MRILIDTHAFLWACIDDAKLSLSARNLFSEADQLYLSSVSVWEIGTKYQQGKLPLPRDPVFYIPVQRNLMRIEALSFMEIDAFQLAKLPKIHKDPFDRMLIAQAIANNLSILTQDTAIMQYPVATVW